jgi:hypothetical protein
MLITFDDQIKKTDNGVVLGQLKLIKRLTMKTRF